MNPQASSAGTKKKDTFKYIFYLLMAVGLILFFKAAAEVTGNIYLLLKSKTATGTVVDIYSDGSSDYADTTRPVAYPVVEFMDDNNNTVKFRSALNGEYMPGIEEKVPVIYESGNSSHAEINSFMALWFNVFLFTIIGAIIFFMGYVGDKIMKFRLHGEPLLPGSEGIIPPTSPH